MGDKCPYECCFYFFSWGVAFQDLFKIAHSFLVSFPSSFFCFIRISVVHPYSSIDTAIAWKKLCFILSDWPDFHMTDNLMRAVYAFVMCILTLFSVDEIILPKYVNLSANFSGLSLRVVIVPSHLSHHEWKQLLAFHIVLIILGKVHIQLFSLQLWVNSRANWAW